jgi:tRNA threonylcarbamoyladenosine biosynthesis protein TsaB
MNVLSLDCSTTTASLSLLNDGDLAAERVWFESRSRHEGLFAAGAAAMAEAGWRWDEVELFAVGRGPGAYSGVRVSLLAVQAWAAPGRVPVVAVSSMEAAALERMERDGLPEVVVVGDARRDTIWYGAVRRDAVDAMATEWKVGARAEAVDLLRGTAPLVTPHRDVLTDLIGGALADRWLAEPLMPKAHAIAQLAFRRRAAGQPSEPLVPIYLHAAV